MSEEIIPARKGRILTVLITTWFLANALTHLFLWFFSGKIYYQLPFIWLNLAEMSIATLNLVLPLLAVRFMLRKKASLSEDFGWRWTGSAVLFWGVLGFLALMGVATIANPLFQNVTLPYGAPGMAGPANRWEFLFLTLHLLIFPALGEEMMFRGFLQTRLTGLYGPTAGILLPAVLFAIRHHPSDIYFGLVNQVPLPGWLNRAVQLYLGAVLFGIVRHHARSTWASWLMHMLILLFILITSGILKQALGF
jgi:membrane protease YdiL (CAAX protease family)